MSDDVTQPKALRGGRQRANHIQVHRIELGKWERDNLLKPLAGVADEALAMAQTVRVARMVATLTAAASLAGVGWATYAGVKKWTGFTESLGETLGGWWKTTGFSKEGRASYDQAVENFDGQGPTLEQTWNFWVGGLIPYPF